MPKREYLLPTIVTLSSTLLLCPTAFADNGAIGNTSMSQQQSAAVSHAPGALAAAPQLTVVGADSGAAQFDAGRVNLGSAAPVAHTFMLRNTTDKPMTITRVHPSCGCLSIEVNGQKQRGQTNTKAGNEETPFQPIAVAPGAELPILVTLDTKQIAQGPVHKFVYIFANGGMRPAAILSMTADATNGVSVEPQALNFGDVKSGAPAMLTLALTVDKTLLAGKPAPMLVSSNPDIRIVEDKAANGARIFQVSLSPQAALGSLSGSVEVANSGGAPYAVVPVTAQVSGPLSASVDMIVFGSVAVGKSQSIDVTLTGPASTDKLSVVSSSKFVDAQLTGNHLKATLSPTAPAGTLNATVTVAAANGVRLSLPVAAYLFLKN